MFRFEKYGNERQYWASEVVRHSVVAVVLLVVGPRTPHLVGPLVVVLSIGLPLEATGLVVVQVVHVTVLEVVHVLVLEVVHVHVVEVVHVLVVEVVHILVVEVVHVLVVRQAVSGLGLILGLVKVMGQAVHIVVVVMALVIVCVALV